MIELTNMKNLKAANDPKYGADAQRPSAASCSTPLDDGHWYWITYHGFKDVTAPAMYKSNVGCFYSYEFAGIPERQCTVIRKA